jgi:DNA modification methylase
MRFLHSEIGSAKDNSRSPVHNWYKFTAGFSHKFVDEIIQLQNLEGQAGSKIFDPFAGCGTTLVSAQKVSVSAVGNESQDFMHDVIRAKLNWKIDQAYVEQHLLKLRKFISEKRKHYDVQKVAHPLLITLYKPVTLKTLYLIKTYLQTIKSTKHKLFFKLALSQTLHKVCIHPIAVPYISRNKILTGGKTIWSTFSLIIKKMLVDSIPLREKKPTSRIYQQDSRFKNARIKANSCTTCITSPPYLNNLDYGEVSKVHTHFFGITDNWNDITTRVRKKLVTGATTHYIDSEFNLPKFRRSAFYKRNTKVGDGLIKRYHKLKKTCSERTGKKSFHILMMLYFQDMYMVLQEIRRVLRPDAKAYLILGDSAPYGVFIQTTKILGKIAMNTGFQHYQIIKIRSRGAKWKNLRFRHNHELSENVLILR